jgi:hypothetical protein
MKIAAMLAAVREAMKYARLENAEFGEIWRDSARGRTAPVLNKDGELVTEANVSDFIRERVANHHGSWIIGTLEAVSQELQSEVRHSFVAEARVEWLCVHCRKSKEHRSHTK